MDGLNLDRDLREALKFQKLQLYYQPKFDLASGKITGVEALIYWEHPKRGLISLTEFIHLLEETDVILSIGEWELRAACAQIKAWQNAGLPPIIMALKIYAHQLYQQNFVGSVERILREVNLIPRYLEFEITEDITMDVHRILPVLKNLKNVGVRISLDDFGRAYSSLLNFRKFPIDIIKIDQSFVNHCTVDMKNAKIVKAIIALAHELNVEVIANGIESGDQLAFLQQNLCDRGQGDLFSKPLHAKDFLSKFKQLEDIIRGNEISYNLCKQQRLKESLHKAQQELADTLRNQQGMTFKYKRQDGKFIYTLCDGALLYRMGKTPEQIVGKEPRDCLPHDDVEQTLQYYLRAWAGEDDVTYSRKLNDVWYIASLHPIRRGRHVVEVIGSCFDITERVKMERQIVEEKEKLESIINNAQDAIQIMDLDGKVLQVNPAWELVYGWTQEEVVGKPIPILLQEQFKNTWSGMVAQIMRGEKIPPYEITVHRKGGELLYASFSIYSINDADGRIVALVSSTRDITEIKKTQELMRKSEKLAVAGQLAAGVAHEIKNPLTTIKGFMQLLQKEIDKPTYFDLILSEIARLNSIVNEFLTLAKPQVALRREVNPKGLMEQVLTVMDPQALLHNIEIMQECDVDLPQISCEENQIKQVLINILQNAIEAMSSGGTITTQISLLGLHSIQFRITDEGCGISEERMKHLGEPFYSSKEKGTGLGLMVSQKIVEEHGGELHIDSAVNQGTTVEVTLPITS
jgi:PAS domain S-box-containing protein